MSVRPRIIQRKRRHEEGFPHVAHHEEVVGGEEAEADDNRRDELGIQENGLFVHGGVMRRILPPPPHVDLSESYQHMKQRRITIEDTLCSKMRPAQPYMENRLPGIADEVESYPCRFCPERVFLTPFGLEKHAKAMHKDMLPEVIRQIRVISEEWKRRNVERSRLRERLSMTRSRQEALAAEAHRHLRRGGHLLAVGEYGYALSSEELDLDGDGQGDDNAPFETCSICHVQINVAHPTALDTHMRAHKRNDELRDNMLAAYGPDTVARLTCAECRLVFTDEKKLHQHNEYMHTRRRRFVCKWCGHIANSVTELNEHKIDVHAMPPSNVHKSARRLTLNRESEQRDKRGRLLAAPRKEASSVFLADTVPCSTSCPECGLELSRPSLLIRHMLRVHSRYSFTAHIETRGMPSFMAHVDRGRVTWTCCGQTHPDSISFGVHRRNSHYAHLGELLGEAPSAEDAMHKTPAHEIELGDEEPEDAHLALQHNIPAGLIEVLVPEGMKEDDGGVYMLLVEDDGEGGQKRSVVKIEPQQQDDDGMQEHMVMGEMNEGSEALRLLPLPHSSRHFSDMMMYMDNDVREERDDEEEESQEAGKGETEEEADLDFFQEDSQQEEEGDIHSHPA